MIIPTDFETESAMEASIREVVRREVAAVRRSPETDSAPAANNNICTLVHHVAGSSIAEIDRLTSELSTLREQLLSQGARVQREITKYAHLNQSVAQSSKILSEGAWKWKTIKQQTHPLSDLPLKG